MEKIPFDEPTDGVAISVETYTAKRAYQIASEYRRRGVPVICGGFHATLCPDEVARYCESIVIGEAETLFPRIIDDYRHGCPEAVYRTNTRPTLGSVLPDRSIFRGKRYLPIGLIETARGCRFKCDFCAVQSFFDSTQTHYPPDRVVEEIRRVAKPGQMIFFIDDNITSDIAVAKELMRAIIDLKVRWVSQSSINVAYDEEALDPIQLAGFYANRGTNCQTAARILGCQWIFFKLHNIFDRDESCQESIFIHERQFLHAVLVKNLLRLTQSDLLLET